MSLYIYGINHHTAPISIREKLAFDESRLPILLQDLISHDAIKETVILSTCNRTEIYADVSDSAVLHNWLAKQNQFCTTELKKYGYTYHNDHAVRHIMRVASGLDSMIIGEPQVLGQLKQAYFIAQNAGTTGIFFNQLFPAVFSASKKIRTKTEISAHPVTLAYAIMQLMKKIFPNNNDHSVLLIGAGKTIELVMLYLHKIGIKNMIVANRTLEKSQNMVRAAQAELIRIQDIPNYLAKTDIVISATASQLPILGKGLIEKILPQKKNPLLLIDLAVPRDIEPEIAELKRVHLYNIDDLQTVISDNFNNRQVAAQQAEKMVDIEAEQFYRKMRMFHARHVIAEYRSRLDKIRELAQEKALHQLAFGADPKTVLEQFGHDLIHKIMHHPTIKLREAASEERCEIFQRIKTFFEIE